MVEGEEPGVALERLFLVVTVPDKRDRAAVRETLDAWYRQRAEEVFVERLAACWPRVETLCVAYPRLTIRAMSTRWGSAGTSGRITLNLMLVQVPRGFIDYVIYHELCHLVEPHHGPAYYALLGRVLPDWRERRDGLNEYEFG